MPGLWRGGGPFLVEGFSPASAARPCSSCGSTRNGALGTVAVEDVASMFFGASRVPSL